MSMIIKVKDPQDEDEIVGAIFMELLKAEGEESALQFLTEVSKYRGKVLRLLSPSIQIQKA